MTPSHEELDIMEAVTLENMYIEGVKDSLIWESNVEMLIEIRLMRCVLDNNWTWLEKIRKGLID